MPTLLAAFLLALPAALPHRQDEPPDPEKVRAAVEELALAFEKGGAAERIAAIGKAAPLAERDVVAGIARGLGDRALEVQKAAIEALRFSEHPSALEALHAACKKDERKLKKEGELHARLLKAIGQHGSRSSIPILTDDPFVAPHHQVIEARILSLGRIRSPESVEVLFDLMKKAGRGRVQPHMESFRLSLMVLTGADEGPSQDLWIRWWNEHKRDLKVAKEPPPLPKMQQLKWDAYWGNERRYERARKRGERGGDPPPGSGERRGGGGR